MGFGLLFLGYTLLLTIGKQINVELGLGIDVLPDVIGYILFLLGLRNLRPYSKNFTFAWYLTIPLIAIGGVILGSELIALLGFWQRPIAILLSYLDYIHYPLLIFFHVYLCLGIKELANEVGLPKIVKRSYTAMILSTLCYLIRLLLPAQVMPQLAMIALLVIYLTYFYMLYYLYSCYARIVYADEEPKPLIPNPLMKMLEKKQNKK